VSPRAQTDDTEFPRIYLRLSACKHQRARSFTPAGCSVSPRDSNTYNSMENRVGDVPNQTKPIDLPHAGSDCYRMGVQVNSMRMCIEGSPVSKSPTKTWLLNFSMDVWTLLLNSSKVIMIAFI